MLSVTIKNNNVQAMEIMSSNRREHLRTAMSAKVRVTHETLGENTYATRDISDGGVFVEVSDPAWFPDVGDQVQVQVQGLPVPAPVLTMKVVRHTEEGFGMQFMDEGADE